MKKNELIKAIASGNTSSIQQTIKQKQGELFIVENFLDALMATSNDTNDFYKDANKVDASSIEIVWRDTPFTRRLMELCENEEKAG